MIAGVFVGGRARRMGGCAKGLLPAPRDNGEARTTVIERTIALARPWSTEVVLVGRADAYAPLRLPALADDATAPGEGPLAGLVALLDHATRAGHGAAIALACDMPYLSRGLFARLAETDFDAPVLAPKDGGKWSPLFARYDASRAGPVAKNLLLSGVRGLQAVLEGCGARELVLSPTERALLRDWDAPGDIDANTEVR